LYSLRRWTRIALALVLVTGISLLVTEGLVRLVLPKYHPGGQISFVLEDGFPLGPRNFSGRLWRNTGDYDVAVHINADGFRDKKNLRDSSAENLFVVGDSFSFGWGVEEEQRYSNRAGILFGRAVYNIAIPTDLEGYGRLIGHARENGAEIRNLIIGVCMENDLQYYRSQPAPSAEEGSIRPQIAGSGLKHFLKRNSALYGAVTSVAHQNPTLKNILSRVGLMTEGVDGMVLNRYVPEIIQDSADRLVRLIQESGAENSLVLLIPSRGLWQGGNVENEQRVHGEFAATLAGLGLDVVDMKPILEKGGAPLDYHFKNDGHWNVAGHDLAARAIHDFWGSRINNEGE
jgi:hypothetical protein